MEKVQSNLVLIDPSIDPESLAAPDRPLFLPVSSAATNTEKTCLDKGVARNQARPGLSREKAVPKKYLVNKLNFINFQDGVVLLRFRHLKYNRTINLPVKPQPYKDGFLEFLWVEEKNIQTLSDRYRLESLLIPDGAKLLQVAPELVHLTHRGLSLKLPPHGYEISSRKVKRHTCRDIQAHLIQNSSIFKGKLLDFSAFSFRVRLRASPPQTFQWLNSKFNVTVIFSDERETYYTGDCQIISHTCGQNSREYVLKPVKTEIQRFKNKEFRSSRCSISPPPDLEFRHPLSKKTICLQAVDLSGSGFAVEEDIQEALLLPGLIIPALGINFVNSLRFTCKAQVIYRHLMSDDKSKSKIKCGLAILDMDIEKHVQFVALLQQTENKHSYVCNKVDLNALWDFFFDTGFIYPKKYDYIQKNKKRIKQTYKKLYSGNPSIARHFVYQDRGRILAHMAMIRYFENTWLIHHHAARNSENSRAGLLVLKQIGSFGNDSHRLYSIHMDYLMCYYRPENKFPSRVFGGACKNIRNSKGCSEDTFAYTHYNVGFDSLDGLSDEFDISPAKDEDLVELKNYYEHVSGGLMLNALNLEPEVSSQRTVFDEYKKLGLKRERYLFSLKYREDLKAVLLINLSDIGINLSDLTNSISVFVIDPAGLPNDVLSAALGQLINERSYEEIPLLIFPAEYAQNTAIRYEKLYKLWVINLQNTDDYFRYLNRLLRFNKN